MAGAEPRAGRGKDFPFRHIKMKYHFDTEVAEKFGVDESIILSNLCYWIKHNADNGVNAFEGCFWTFNTAEAFQKQFPFWGVQKIKKMLANLEEIGVLKSDCFNEHGYDRTKWYTVIDEWVCERYIDKSLKCIIVPNGLMDSSKPTDALFQTDPPIPDNKPDNKLQKECGTYAADSPEMTLSLYLLKLIRQHDPRFKEPNLQSWCEGINALIRIDGRDLSEIARVIQFAQSSSFWKSNILSTKKLRMKYSTLLIQMKEKNNGNTNGKRSRGAYAGFDAAAYPTIKDGSAPNV